MKAPTTEVRICEVGARDGLQNVKGAVPTATKLDLIHRLEQTGLRAIELTSIVSPRAIPQLADCQDLLANHDIHHLQEQSALHLPVLVPNMKGLDIATRHGVKEIAVFVSATENFSKANINCTVREGIERAKNVAEKALRSNIAVRGYVSCIFADPFDGRPTSPSTVLRCVKALLDMGCYEVSLGDTTGVGRPSTVHSLTKYLTDNGVPVDRLAGHFHDTNGHGLSNVWQAFKCGIRVFDSSVAGLGGCPFAKDSKGNVPTEDLVYMFHNAGIETGVDLLKLIETGVWITRNLSLPNASRVGRELTVKPKVAHTSSATPSAKPIFPWSLAKDGEGLFMHRPGANLRIAFDLPMDGNT